MIYAGNLAQNGITTSLKSLCSAVNTASVNYYVVFTSRVVKRHRDVLLEIPEQIKFIPVSGKAVMQPQEKTVQYLYGKKRIPFPTFDKHLREAYKFECKRQFGKLSIDVAVQFNGYDFKKIYQFSVLSARRVIFAHSDMAQEIAVKHNSRSDLLEYAYQEYDQVAIVSPDIEPSIQCIANDRANTLYVPNLFDYKRVISLAHEDMSFDDQTISTVNDIENVIAMLKKHGDHTVVSIGRFSPEKQHALLIEAFNELWLDDPSIRLLIIGGNSHSDIYQGTRTHVESLPCKNSVVLIRQVSNPYAFVEHCCGLILSSVYEGFGLVLLEADALGKPIVSTDIVGPRIFMQEHNGTLVDNSYEGIKEGLRMLYAGEVVPLNLNYEKYNANALRAFYKLLDL